MKKLLFITILSVTLLLKPPVTLAQSMMGGSREATIDGHTAREEAEGKEVWEKLQAKQLECKNLTNDNFETLGEYFMGQMAGSSHEAMNNMMERMMGQTGEQQMHIVMGKRLSGCEPATSHPNSGFGFTPMMWMMGSVFSRWPSGFGGTKGGGNPMMDYGGWNNMMGWGGFGVLAWIPMLLFWIILILGVIALIRYLGDGSPKNSKTPLDILKERYAKGEITKKEFEEMKKDLG